MARDCANAVCFNRRSDTFDELQWQIDVGVAWLSPHDTFGAAFNARETCKDVDQA